MSPPNCPNAPAHVCTSKPDLKDARTRAQGSTTRCGLTRCSPPRAGQERHIWGHGPPRAPGTPRLPWGAWERNLGGHGPEGRRHRRYCTYSTDTSDHESENTGRNHAKRGTELCMRRGPKCRGEQISIFLAGTGQGLLHRGHGTGTTTSDRTTTSTLRTDRDDHTDNDRMRQHQLQRNKPNGKQADHEAGDGMRLQPNRCRNHNPTTHRPHASRTTPHRPGVQGSKRERRPAGRRHLGAPHLPTTMPTGTKGHHSPTILQLTNQQQRTNSNLGLPGRAQTRPSQEA